MTTFVHSNLKDDVDASIPAYYVLITEIASVISSGALDIKISQQFNPSEVHQTI